jgi:hypothetical protein
MIIKQALLIDATKRTVSKYEFPNGDYLYVNDEGLINGTRDFFDIGAHSPFAGNGVLVGPADDEGDDTDVQSTCDQICHSVRFMSVDDIQRAVASGEFQDEVRS